MDRTYRRGYDRGYGREHDYGRRYDREHPGEDRGFFERATDEVRSWFGDDDAQRRRRMGDRYDEDRYERRPGRPPDFEARDRYESRYDRSGYPDRAEDWNEGLRGGYGPRRPSYEGSGYGRGYDPGYDRDYDRRSGRDADRFGAQGRYELTGGAGGYDRPSGRDPRRNAGRNYDYDRGDAGGYGGEYRPRASHPEYGADRYDRDSYRDYGFPGWTYGQGRQ